MKQTQGRCSRCGGLTSELAVIGWRPVCIRCFGLVLWSGFGTQRREGY